MKLNYECMRDVLLTLEQCLDLDDDFSYNELKLNEVVDIPVLCNKYSKKDIAYSVYMLSDAGLIMYEPPRPVKAPNSGVIVYFSGDCVNSITYKGHEFIQQIQNETVWNKTKEKLKPLGIMTVEIISQVASNIITQILSQ